MPEIQMPKLSDTMTEGTLVAWKKKKGDNVSAGEVLAEIETDKATMEWESPEDGTLAEIYVEEGGKVNVGDKIAFIGGEGEEAPKEEEKGKEEKPEVEKEKEEEKPDEVKAKEKEPTKEEPKKEPEKKGEPKTEKKEKAVEAGVSPAPTQPTRLPPQPEEARVKGSGPDGRVTETDVRAAAKSKIGARQPSAPAIKAGESARIQLSGMRKIIAQRLVESLGPIPHFYLNIEIDAGPLME